MVRPAVTFFRYAGSHMHVSTFDVDGFAVADDVIPYSECDTLAARVNSIGERSAGSRCLLDYDWCCETAEHLRACLSSTFACVRRLLIVQCTYFRKTQAKNWLVTWHQDRSIPVESHVDCERLTGWSVKEGMTFVHAPGDLLATMVAVRLHLDNSTPDNGPLRVIAGSHRRGTLSQDTIDDIRKNEMETTCVVGKGGVLLMRPLLLHASSKSTTLEPRRVLHFLFGPAQLPHGLKWRRAV